MEVCGGQTHTIVKSGLQDLLPPEITLVHGPGCPVCVTPLEMIDRAVAIAAAPGGDLLLVRRHAARARVRRKSLFEAKAEGARRAHRLLAAGCRASSLARTRSARSSSSPSGFETTAPANAMAVWQAEREGIANFSMLVSHVLVPPAIEAILSSPNCRVQAFLAAGHVCTVMGFEEYRPHRADSTACRSWSPASSRSTCSKACRWRCSSWRAAAPRSRTSTAARCGARAIVRRSNASPKCSRSARAPGAASARFPSSGLRLREAYRRFDARARFAVDDGPGRGIDRVHRRAGFAGPEEAARMSGLRHPLHAGHAARRADGFDPKAPARPTYLSEDGQMMEFELAARSAMPRR